MEKKWKKIGGFIFLIVIVLLVLQVISQLKCGNKVMVGESTSFAPEEKVAIDKTEPPKQEETQSEQEKKQTEQEPDKLANKQSDIKKEDVSKQEPEQQDSAKDNKKDEPEPEDQSKQASNDSQPDNSQDLKNKSEAVESKKEETPINQQKDQISKANDAIKPITGKKALDAVYVSDQDFRAIDDIQEKVKEYVKGEQEPSKYRWAIVSSYEEPDKAVQILGGIPFAIDAKNKLYYRIFPEKNKMASVMLGTTYGTNGIPAHDPKFSKIATDFAYKGMITSSPDALDYIYLFTSDRVSYINGKVISVFEWFIKKAGYNDEQAEEFRKKSMICFAVWQVLRDGSKGETGSIIPVYFESSDGQKQFLSQEYYKTDSEANKLGIKEIDQKEYM